MKELEQLWISVSERFSNERIKKIILVPKRIRLWFWKIKKVLECPSFEKVIKHISDTYEEDCQEPNCLFCKIFYEIMEKYEFSGYISKTWDYDE